MRYKIPAGLHRIHFEGGLGNQMFQYAFYLAVKRAYPFAFYCFDVFNVCDIDKIFNIRFGYNVWLNKISNFLSDKGLVSFLVVSEKEFWMYDSSVFVQANHPLWFWGYRQTEKYFKKIEKVIRKTFMFDKCKLSEYTRNFADRIIQNDRPTVSVHVRRGDYLKEERRRTCDSQYYADAINYIVKKLHTCNIVLVVFSDDISWCRDNLTFNGDVVFVDWNEEDNSWQDMFLMSQCKHNIIANSTFSWWGAWLNNNEEKIVIAPKKWMTYEPAHTDIIPETWVRL